MSTRSYDPSTEQQRRLDEWLPAAVVVRDNSWGLVERAVWELESAGGRFIAKIGGITDHHIGREIHAHLHWLGPWVRHGRAPELVHHDIEANLLVTRYVPGDLVLGTPAADDPDTFEQSGRLLAQLHDQPGHVDHDHEVRENHKALTWLGRPHRIPPDAERLLRKEIIAWPTPPTPLVPTHGDWQPRNWLISDGQVRVIDFGRAALQPAAWRRIRVRMAIGTAVWAHQVGDEEFEAQGLRMIDDVLG